MPKTVKGAFWKSNLLQNIQKNWRDKKIGDIKTFSKKSVTKQKQAKKFNQVRDLNPRSYASQTSNNQD